MSSFALVLCFHTWALSDCSFTKGASSWQTCAEQGATTQHVSFRPPSVPSSLAHAHPSPPRPPARHGSAQRPSLEPKRPRWSTLIETISPGVTGATGAICPGATGAICPGATGAAGAIFTGSFMSVGQVYVKNQAGSIFTGSGFWWSRVTRCPRARAARGQWPRIVSCHS